MRSGFRALFQRPWFTLAAVSVLAVGIGANTAIFSLVNAFLLRPLVLRNPQELTGVYSRDTKKLDSYRAFSYPNYADLRASGGAIFTSLAAHNLAMVGLAEGDTTRRLMAEIVSSNWFDTLGAPVWRGRSFTADEERPGSALPVVITSYSFWKRNGSPPDFLGRTIRINGHDLTVVGIAREGFNGTMALLSPEVYVPLGMYESVDNGFDGTTRPLAARDNHALIVVGRLRQGQSPQAVDRQLAVIGAGMEQAFPAENKDQTLIARPLSRLSVSTNPGNDSGMRIPATLLSAMAAVVLLIAALNVTNMMLARGTARRKEIAIRLALGGGRGQIVRQLFFEGLLLALIGGAAGLLLSYAGNTLFVRSLLQLAPFDLFIPAGPDIRVLAATLAFCLFTTLLFGLVPAWKLSRPSLVGDLRASDNAELSAGRGRLFSRRNLLVIAQVSLSLALLTAAGLFLRSAGRVAGVDPGFQLENGVMAEFDASLAGYPEARGRQIYKTLLDHMRSTPGVESAGLAATVPFGMVSLGRAVQPAGSQAKPQNCTSNVVSDGYFRTLGIPLLRGRDFTAADASTTTRPVAIVDKLAAEHLWAGGDAVGRHVRITGGDNGTDMPDVEIVGVVGNIRDHIIGNVGASNGLNGAQHIYLPFGQQYQADMHIHLRTVPLSPPAAANFLLTVRQEFRSIDSGLPVLMVRSLRTHLESSVDYWVIQMGARMFSVFSAIALLLAVIGLYGVRAYSVARRTREIGIRMALGASASAAQKMVLREGIQLMAVGAGAGLVLSLLLGKVLAGLLFQVSGADPMVFSAAVLLLGVSSAAACYFPARRAARIDPMVALRYE